MIQVTERARRVLKYLRTESDPHGLAQVSHTSIERACDLGSGVASGVVRSMDEDGLIGIEAQPRTGKRLEATIYMITELGQQALDQEENENG